MRVCNIVMPLLETPPTTNRKYYNSKPIIITKLQRRGMSRNSSRIPIIITKRSDEDTSYREDNSSILFCCFYDMFDELIYNAFSTCTPIAYVDVCTEGDGCSAFTWTE